MLSGLGPSHGRGRTGLRVRESQQGRLGLASKRRVAGEEFELSESYLRVAGALLVIAGTEMYLRGRRRLSDNEDEEADLASRLFEV